MVDLVIGVVGNVVGNAVRNVVIGVVGNVVIAVVIDVVKNAGPWVAHESVCESVCESEGENVLRNFFGRLSRSFGGERRLQGQRSREEPGGRIDSEETRFVFEQWLVVSTWVEDCTHLSDTVRPHMSH